MPESCAVVIGAPEHLDALRKRVDGESEVLAFPDREVTKALEAITTRRAGVVVLERLFAATSRGAALINRIKADPDLTFAEIRIVAHCPVAGPFPRRCIGFIISDSPAHYCCAKPALSCAGMI